MPELAFPSASPIEQTAFNLRRWAELIDDENLATWQGRVETDQHGALLMSPPASAIRGRYQVEIPCLLNTLLSGGKCVIACPISTSEGVRVTDAAWISEARLAEIGFEVCLTKAPEICIEILSPRDTWQEMEKRKALYFAAGAEEVWFCLKGGRMRFFTEAASLGETASRLCPGFPAQISL